MTTAEQFKQALNQTVKSSCLLSGSDPLYRIEKEFMYELIGRSDETKKTYLPIWCDCVDLPDYYWACKTLSVKLQSSIYILFETYIETVVVKKIRCTKKIVSLPRPKRGTWGGHYLCSTREDSPLNSCRNIILNT